MVSSNSLLLAAVAALIPTTVLADYTAGGFTMSAASKSTTVSTITVKGPLTSTQWVGFGIVAADHGSNDMNKADIFIVTSDGKVTTGKGDCSAGCRFVSGATTNTVTSAASKYPNSK
jgi:hypothetical protein